MVLFIVKTEVNKKSKQYFKEVGERLKGDSLGKNPFNRSLIKSFGEYTVISFNPVYPPLYYMGFAGFLLAIVFGWGLWSYFVSAFFSLQGVFFSKYFYYYVSKYAYSKKVKGSYSLVPKNSFIREVIL